MTDIGLVLHKLQRLAEQVALLRARRPPVADVLDHDLILRDAMALALLVALQEAIDIAYHLAADEGWGVPDSYSGAFELLANHGVLNAELAQRMSLAARMRNRIAHGYASMDHARLWRELPDGIGAMEDFARAVAAWLPSP